MKIRSRTWQGIVRNWDEQRHEAPSRTGGRQQAPCGGGLRMEAAEFLRLKQRLHRIPQVGGLESCFAISGWQWATFPVGFFAFWGAH